MNEINPQQLLSQLRTMNAQLNATGSASAATATESVSFGGLLKDSIGAVNAAQQTAGAGAAAFSAGDKSTDLSEVMIGLQKADLSFRTMAEVRNKLVNAYQEIMNMPV